MDDGVARVRVAVIDDHELARGGLLAMLRTAPWIEIAGAADGCADGIRLAVEASPDVVLVDIRMPEVDGLHCLSRLLDLTPPPKVIMVSGFDEAADVLEAINRGAAGYLLKSIGAHTLVEGVRDVVAGRLAIDPELLRLALSETPRAAPMPAANVASLTAREMDVLRLVAEGQTNKEIGGKLGISEDTVKKHVQNVIWKLNAADRTQAAILAMRLGLLEYETT
jgi:DNA-binding NarL/FixJ family response regulator